MSDDLTLPELEFVGEFEAATDGSMAAVLARLDSVSRQRVLDIIVPALAAFPDVTEAATAAAEAALDDAQIVRTASSVEDDSDDAVMRFAVGARVGLNDEGYFSRRTAEHLGAGAFTAPHTDVVRDGAGRLVSETIGGVPVRNMLRDSAGRTSQYSIGDRTVSVNRDAAGRLTGETSA